MAVQVDNINLNETGYIVSNWRETKYRRLVTERQNVAGNLEGYRTQGTPGRPMTALIAEAIAEAIARLAKVDEELAALDIVVEIPVSTLVDGRAAVRRLERRLVVL